MQETKHSSKEAEYIGPVNFKSTSTVVISSTLVVYACGTLLRFNQLLIWLFVVAPLASASLSIFILAVYTWFEYHTKHICIVSLKELETLLKKSKGKDGVPRKARKVSLDKLPSLMFQSPSIQHLQKIPIDLEQALDPNEKILIMSSDPFLDSNNLQRIDLSHVDIEKLVAKFRKNRISLCAIEKASKNFPMWPVQRLKNEIEKDKQVFQTRLNTILSVVKLFNQADVDFLLIKSNRFIDSYYATDVDILTRNLEDEVSTLKTLEQEGFALTRLSSNVSPFKITATKDGFVDIDFYPHLEWFRFNLVSMKIKNVDMVFENKSFIKSARDDQNASYYTPSVEDDILIASLHDFSHRFVPYASILHIIGIMENCCVDWQKLMMSALESDLLIPLYIHLSLINKYSSMFYNCKIVPSQIIDVLDSKRTCRLTHKMLRLNGSVPDFPFRIPLSIIILDVVARTLKRNRI